MKNLSDDPLARLQECRGDSFIACHVDESCGQAPAFQREDRYIVIKRSDLQQAEHHALTAFHGAHYNLRESMSKNGVPDRQFVVIESDWPEYETVWSMIESRLTGKKAEFDEESERAKYEEFRKREELGSSSMCGFWRGWLACAKSKAEGK